MHKLGLQGHRVIQALQNVEAELVPKAAGIGDVLIEVDDPLPVPLPGLFIELDLEILLFLLGRALAPDADGPVGRGKAVAQFSGNGPLLVPDLEEAVHAVAAHPHAGVVGVSQSADFRPGVVRIVRSLAGRGREVEGDDRSRILAGVDVHIVVEVLRFFIIREFHGFVLIRIDGFLFVRPQKGGHVIGPAGGQGKY